MPPEGKAAIAESGEQLSHKHYPIIALVLQGGGALGSYQAGVYEGLDEGGIHPNWIAGISIGALNAAIIAGNPVGTRVEKLRQFWAHICKQPALPPTPYDWVGNAMSQWPERLRAWADVLESNRALLEGQNGFFLPRPWSEQVFGHKGPETASFYDTTPLRETLEQFADFDRINHKREMRVSVGAVNIRTGNFIYFDNRKMILKPEHFMASGALPPGFPAVEIDGEHYWDGGLVSNTPLSYVLAEEPRQDSLIFQIDLWSAQGEAPDTLLQVATRQKEIQYSSRTRAITDRLQYEQRLRRTLSEVMKLVPESERDSEWYKRAARAACDARHNVIHMIYREKPFEGYAKDYQFGALTMREHWESGLEDMRHTMAHRHWLEMPSAEHPFVTHDLLRTQKR